MDKKIVKRYFSKENTAYKWWNPHKSDKKHIYKRQEEIVKKIVLEHGIKKILDVSSGKGRYAKILARNRNYTCLDISQQMLDHIKKYKLNIRLIKGDAEKIPLKEKFEGIICSESLVHYPHPIRALKEMRRLLHDRGVIIITTDNRHCLGKIIRLIEDFFRGLFKLSKKGIGNEIYQPYSDKEYQKMFSKANLKIRKKINLSILTTPIKSYSFDRYIWPPELCIHLLWIDKILEKIPLIKSLSTYFIYVLGK